MELPCKDLMDVLSLTRERVRVWVSAPLPVTPTHWRRSTILIRGISAGPPAPSPQPSPVNLTGERSDTQRVGCELAPQPAVDRRAMNAQPARRFRNVIVGRFEHGPDGLRLLIDRAGVGLERA